MPLFPAIFLNLHTQNPPRATCYASFRKCTPNSHIRPTKRGKTEVDIIVEKHHDNSACDLESIDTGQSVTFKKLPNSQWTPGTVTGKVDDRSYIVSDSK